MATPTLSSLWYRVADLRPQLRSHVRLARHTYRGQEWFVLMDAATGRTHRFTPAARFVMGLMDGNHTVGQIWSIADATLGDDAPTQDQMIDLLGQLHARDLLQSDVAPQTGDMVTRRKKEMSARHRRSFGNPMALRVHLWDPDAFLNRIHGVVRPLWGPLGAVLWLLVVVPALVLLPQHIGELTHNFRDHMLSPNSLLIAFFVFPAIKILHELGHATATKAGGGEVHDLGILLLVLLPVPYVDASAASVFRSKYQRAIVGAAGMLVEVFIAAVAFFIWILVEPGLFRSVLFNVMAIAGISTLVFNGNPLLRYDAYYILSDLIEIPNLGTRSLKYWTYLLERYVYGVEGAEPPATFWGEKLWLLGYGVLSTIYRLMITVIIALYIASHFFLAGVILAVWTVAAMVLMPLFKGVRHLVGHPQLRRKRLRTLTATVAMIGVVSFLIFGVPLPSHTSSEGVVWLPESSIVRARTGSFVEAVAATSGDRVSPGDALLYARDNRLTADVRVAEAKVRELEATYTQDFASDAGKAQVTYERLLHERERLARLKDRTDELTIRAGTTGKFVAPQVNDLVGRFVQRGELIGYVISEQSPVLRVVVPQESVDKSRMDTDRVRIKFAGDLDQTLHGRIVREVPGGDETLPSKALTAEGGGTIAVDPRDQKGTKAFERMFQFDIELSDGHSVATYGQRAYVRFEHRPETLALRGWREARLLFLSRFGV